MTRAPDPGRLGEAARGIALLVGMAVAAVATAAAIGGLVLSFVG